MNVVEELGSLLSCIIDGIENVPLWKFTKSSILKKNLYEYQYIYIKQILYLIGQVECMPPDSEALLPLEKS